MGLEQVNIKSGDRWSWIWRTCPVEAATMVVWFSKEVNLSSEHEIRMFTRGTAMHGTDGYENAAILSASRMVQWLLGTNTPQIGGVLVLLPSEYSCIPPYGRWPVDRTHKKPHNAFPIFQRCLPNYRK